MAGKKQIGGQDFCKCGHKEFHHIFIHGNRICGMGGCDCEDFSSRDSDDSQKILTQKLTKKQQEILDRIRRGERCLHAIDGYWFMCETYEKCTTQIFALEKKGFVEIIGFGICSKLKVDGKVID